MILAINDDFPFGLLRTKSLVELSFFPMASVPQGIAYAIAEKQKWDERRQTPVRHTCRKGVFPTLNIDL
jgi:hypothetical protein